MNANEDLGKGRELLGEGLANPFFVVVSIMINCGSGSLLMVIYQSVSLRYELSLITLVSLGDEH